MAYQLLFHIIIQFKRHFANDKILIEQSLKPLRFTPQDLMSSLELVPVIIYDLSKMRVVVVDLQSVMNEINDVCTHVITSRSAPCNIDPPPTPCPHHDHLQYWHCLQLFYQPVCRGSIFVGVDVVHCGIEPFNILDRDTSLEVVIYKPDICEGKLPHDGHIDDAVTTPENSLDFTQTVNIDRSSLYKITLRAVQVSVIQSMIYWSFPELVCMQRWMMREFEKRCEVRTLTNGWSARCRRLDRSTALDKVPHHEKK